MQTFGTWLLRELGERDWSARKLAGMLGVSSTAVNRWVHDEREPSREMLLRIAEALGVSPVVVALAYLGALPEGDAPLDGFSRLPPQGQAEVLSAMSELMDMVVRQTEETRRGVAEWSERWLRSGGGSGAFDRPSG